MTRGAWSPRLSKWKWRDFLTADEAKFVLKADLLRADLVARNAAYQDQYRPHLLLIVNRAIQRAKYDAKRGKKR